MTIAQERKASSSDVASSNTNIGNSNTEYSAFISRIHSNNFEN